MFITANKFSSSSSSSSSSSDSRICRRIFVCRKSAEKFRLAEIAAKKMFSRISAGKKYDILIIRLIKLCSADVV